MKQFKEWLSDYLRYFLLLLAAVLAFFLILAGVKIYQNAKKPDAANAIQILTETGTEDATKAQTETVSDSARTSETETESEQETTAPVETETETEQQTETRKQTQKTTEAPKSGTTNGGSTPKTGDNTNIWLWLFLLMASGALLSKDAFRRRTAGGKKQS